MARFAASPDVRPRSVVREPLARRVARLVLRAYARRWHHLSLEGMENVPPHGPALVMSNHSSMLDVLALMAADPFPDTVFVVKASMLDVPIVRNLLLLWHAIPVERHGHDASGIRALLAALRAGRVAALAPEGTRSRTGRLGRINPVLARIAVRAQVPIIPVGIAGSFAALPPGAYVPRPMPIHLRVGPLLYLPPDTSAEAAAEAIQSAIARLLPPEQRPRG